MPRPSQPLLSRQRIVDVALHIIDPEGLAALSTRRLAAELHVRAPSLYNHFATKEEILDAAADAVISTVDISMFGPHEWPDALREWARGYRAALAPHPHIVPLLARAPSGGAAPRRRRVRGTRRRRVATRVRDPDRRHDAVLRVRLDARLVRPR